MLADAYITGLFEAVVEATKERSSTRWSPRVPPRAADGIVAHALPGERLARAVAAPAC
jgi:hypothetical protein